MRLLSLFLFVSIAANLLFAWYFLQTTPVAKSNDEQVQQAQFPYLSKRIFAENQNDILINFIPLRTAMREYVTKQQEPIGVYFEYLPSGSSIGVNEKLEIALASLIKTPLVMGVYQQFEKGKLKKDDMLTIKKEDLDPKFGDLWKKGAGTTIRVEEAINLTLINSDNTAANALAAVVPVTTIDTVFDSLDIQTDQKGEVTLISPKSYSSVLRSLYLSSYLTREHSNEILDILTATSFTDKLPAGLPKSIKIAHKIGVFESENAFSDCGIIYVPERPYLLCIMIKADNQTATKHMLLLSKMVYGYILAVNQDK